MSEEEENVATVNRFYDLLFSGKLPESGPLFCDNLVLHEPYSLPYGGDYHGMQGMLTLSAAVDSSWDDLKVERIQMTAGGHYVMSRMVLSGTHPKTRRAWSTPHMEEFRFEDGKIREVTIFYFDTSRVAWAAEFAPDQATFC